MKYDSDFDVVVDFPAAAETEAAEFVEEACRRRELPSDVHLKSRATDQFLDRISDRMVILPRATPGGRTSRLTSNRGSCTSAFRVRLRDAIAEFKRKIDPGS